jgi:hypothetical protein
VKKSMLAGSFLTLGVLLAAANTTHAQDCCCIPHPAVAGKELCIEGITAQCCDMERGRKVVSCKQCDMPASGVRARRGSGRLGVPGTPIDPD